MKNFKDLSLNITEEEYRTDSALSYSILARYEREGFNNLDKLFDKIETPSLTFGASVDALITGGQEEFDSRFMIADFPDTPDSIVQIVKALFNEFSVTHRTLESIPNEEVIGFASRFNYQNNWKPETRAKVIKEKGAGYYNILFTAGNKTILDTQTYQDVCNAVRALKESKSTQFYFADNNPFEPNIERFYQLKFKACLKGIKYKCMADLIVCDYENKIIYPIDLKTSSHTEWDFYKSFIEWSYAIQARLYWRIIRNNLDRDEYFKDFKLADYKFIVVNRKTLTPLVWEFTNTTALGTLYFGKNKQIEMRDPEEIGKELSYYLSSRPKVPINIYETESNDLKNWLNKL